MEDNFEKCDFEENNEDCSITKADNVNNVEDENHCVDDRFLMRKSIIEHISSNDRIIFNSSTKSEEDLSKQDKGEVVGELLDRNYGLFLAKFGNYLLKEHLDYFENRSEEESVIVDLHLTHIKKALDKSCTTKKHPPRLQCDTPSDADMEVSADLRSAENGRFLLRQQLLDHLSLSEDAHFKSQQVGEPDLSRAEKREIADNLLDRSPSLFLSRFGTHICEEHLAYFDAGVPPEEQYEVSYHLKQLRKTQCKAVSKVGIKNRRFEALKQMVGEGTYFCESEMRNRNPLLYEQLVGRFMTPDERRERLDQIDTTNITFVNLLLEQMDRENVKKLRKEQEDEEDNVMEEEEENESESAMEAEDSDSGDDNDLDKTLWGEQVVDNEPKKTFKHEKITNDKKLQDRKNEEAILEMSDAEKKLLLEEFRSNMFSSFLQGKDVDFDYSQVDNNSDYDDLEMRGQDEEEKYFDEESPEDGISNRMSDDEDALEHYMGNLKPEPTTAQLTDQLSCLSHQET